MSSLAAEQRREWLLAHLRSTNAVSLADAAESLGVSEMTVRRDLDNLEASGVARRVRGGAIYSGPVSFEGRDRSHVTAKRLIADKLLPLVPTSGLIAIDSSTTMHRLAQALVGSGDLVVVTNGLLTFKALQERPGITPILTGGAPDVRSGSLVGPVAAATVENLRFSCFFSSTAALDQRTCFEDTLEEASIKRAFARSATNVFVGAHAQKLGQEATAASLKMSEITALVTDLDPTAAAVSRFAEVVERIY